LRRRLGTRLSLERLEDRRLLTVITPMTFGDTNATFNPATYFTSPPSPTGKISVPTLRDAVIEANYLYSTVNPGVANTISLQRGIYTLSIANGATHESASATGDLNITGNLTVQGFSIAGIPFTTISQTAADRVFEINAGTTSVAPTQVTFQNLTIQGGRAYDNGTDVAPGTTAAEGGGILDTVGANLTLSGVILQNDRALGASGKGTSTATPGPEAALGGGLYVSGGAVSLTNVTFLNDQAVAGGGAAGVGTSGAGGNGGMAIGGGLYANGTAVTFGSSSKLLSVVSFLGDKAIGGNGGNGTSGDDGGSGGSGGAAEGGGLAAVGGATVGDTTSMNLTSFSLDLANFVGNAALGGNGGLGGAGSTHGGSGGGGGGGAGGGLFSDGSTVTLTGGNLTGNLAQGGNAGGSGSGGAVPEGLRHQPLATLTEGGAGVGGGLAAVDDSVVSLTLLNVAGNTAKGGNGSPGGNGTGNSGIGGFGGFGGSACGGGLFADTSTLTIVGANISLNTAQGGNGGAGGNGGTGAEGMGGGGGAGGDGSGGGIYASDSQVSLSGGLLTLNRALGGAGGAGGTGATGGSGGFGGYASGGAIYDFAAPVDSPRIVTHKVLHAPAAPANTNLTLSGALVTINRALGGNGAVGGASTATGTGTGGSGGSGGDGVGGALYIDGLTATITLHALLTNLAQGGCGASGATGSTLGDAGDGGWGVGGALYVVQGTVSVNLALLELNATLGGAGGRTGATGSGIGGDALGAGAFVDFGGSLTLQNTLVMVNIATAGPGGMAFGGGVYVYNGTTPGTLTQTGFTMILVNLPDNIDYGTLTEF